MYKIYKSKQFEKSFKKISKQKNFKKEELEHVLTQLVLGNKLEAKYRDHKLIGKYEGYRECHVQNDILLIYFYESDTLTLLLIDFGSHSQLF
jgi:mRNA interferase YafQ